MATAVLSGAASLAGQVAMLPVTGVQKIYEEYSEMNESSLSGAIDIIAVRQPDGRLKSTPFHVRFGRFSGVLRPADKVVTIKVNDTEVPLQMKLGRSGEACVSPRPTAEPIRSALTYSASAGTLCTRRMSRTNSMTTSPSPPSCPRGGPPSRAAPAAPRCFPRSRSRKLSHRHRAAMISPR